MAGVRASSDARVTVLHHRKDIFWIPHFVVCVVVAAFVLVDADADVVFLDQRFDDVQLSDGFGGDAVEVQLLGELKDFAPLGRVAGADHAVVDSDDAGLGQLGFERVHVFVRHIVVHFRAGAVGGKFLAGVEFDHFAAGFDGFVDGFEGGEIIKSPGLDAQGEAACVVLGRDIHRRELSGGEGAQGAGQKQV